MDSLHYPRVLIQHPSWCTSNHTNPGESWSDPDHRGESEPLLLTADDYELGVRLTRMDVCPIGELTQHAGATELELTVTSLSLLDADGDPLRTAPCLTPTDARRLAALLTVFADAAELESVEVTW